jgi:hypothetical protein
MNTGLCGSLGCDAWAVFTPTGLVSLEYQGPLFCFFVSLVY